MRSEFDVKEAHSVKALIKSFKHAFFGILTSFVIGRNIKVHYTALLVAVLGGLYFGISKLEFLAILLISAQVISLEMVNTAIERTVDLVTSDYHVYAKYCKGCCRWSGFDRVNYRGLLLGELFFFHIFLISRVKS